MKKINDYKGIGIEIGLASSLHQSWNKWANGARDVPEEPDQVITKLAEQILRYLEAHPNAADSFEGIKRWWLQSTVPSVNPEAVHAALDTLVQRRLLNRVELAGGQVIYSRAADN